MIYKIGTIADMDSIVFESDDVKQLVYHYARILTEEYGADRNVDTDDGGYILYATMGTNAKEIKTFFDYTSNLVEFVEVDGELCAALYMLSSDYGVVIIISLVDAPPEILNEIKKQTEEF